MRRRLLGSILLLLELPKPLILLFLFFHHLIPIHSSFVLPIIRRMSPLSVSANIDDSIPLSFTTSTTIMENNSNNNDPSYDNEVDNNAQSSSGSVPTVNNGNGIVLNKITKQTSPRTCILQVGISAGQLCAVANTHLLALHQNNKNKSINDINNNDDAILVQALKDLLIDLWMTSQSLQLNLMVAIRNKMALNNKKYPVELCKGKAGKYTQYSAQTGITKTNQSTLDMTTTTTSSNNGGTNDNQNSSSSSSNTTEETNNKNIPSAAQSLFSAIPLSQVRQDLEMLAKDLDDFATARHWAQFHTPRNLVLALMGEFGELAELLQWEGDDDTKSSSSSSSLEPKLLDKLSQELADVTIYLVRLATVCQLVQPLCEAVKKVENDYLID